MNSEVKAEWLSALRSGEYEQGNGALNRDGKYCCLGVLCDLAVKAGEVTSAAEAHTTFYDGHDSLPSPKVAEWAGLDRINPTVKMPDGCLADLASLNDSGHDMSGPFSFSEIADLVEAQL